MTVQLGSKWFVFSWSLPRIFLGGPFDTEAGAIAYLALYQGVNDPIVRR